MKKLLALLLVMAMALSLAACGECDHEWEKATCEEPKTCSECGETKGEPLGHDWEEVDGEMVCAECDEVCDHKFKDGECKYCGMAEDEEGGAAIQVPEEDDEPVITEPSQAPTETPSYSSCTSGGEFTFTWEEYESLLNATLLDQGSSLQVYFDHIDSDGDALYYVYNTATGYDEDAFFMYLLFDDYDDTLEEVMLFCPLDASEAELSYFIELTVAASTAADWDMTYSEACNIYSLDPIYEDEVSMITEYYPRDVVHLLMLDGENMMIYYTICSENNY